ncbi:hypothetical protein A2V49_02830 [candidate division WWE3 bacterium RBG_19FT_COMBO_34_6]|uniref:Uncharacterized protein n=1 Tax=candidate division WWE3 bacterium RBG_19FT_COMBO_34_6 TaxID=1802612 RepID=A0A1F4UNJ9_UNCKA|nr:MAG: hypothetical protein A2V49_02830 [candidate division WWE3 bacterium RBG_19FT_COMBO_34_6]
MTNPKKHLITFAGPVGSSKSPIAYYLSHKLNLPIFNNDTIRTEITEDLIVFDQDEYIRRRDLRLKDLLDKNASFIYDASVDREWKNKYKIVNEYKYKYFIISLDLSKDLLLKLYNAKGYHESVERLEQLFIDHQNFLSEYSSIVGIHITDDNFYNRLEICYDAVFKWLKK